MHNTHNLESKLRMVLVVTGAVLAFAISAMAQVEQPSQISLQGIALVTKNTDTDTRPLSHRATKSGGFLVGYSYQFTRWAGLEGNYGFTQNTQEYSGSVGRSIRSDFHELTGSFVVHIPVSVRHVRPFGLAGAGALIFNPTGKGGDVEIQAINFVADRQTRAAFVYGGGVNFDLTRNIGVRVEYRGLVYKVPDFTLDNLNLDKITHLAQPSAGIVFRF